jgi:hypothetical protein
MSQSAWHHGHVADRPDSDREVLTSLPRTRPVRRSDKREERPRTAAAATKPKGKQTSKPPAADAAQGRKPAAKPRATAQPKATPRTAGRSAGAGGARTAGRSGSAGGERTAAPRARSGPRRTVPPAGYASPTRAEEEQRFASADVLGTAVQAAGELAQIGFAVGRQALQSMLDRLPKP